MAGRTRVGWAVLAVGAIVVVGCSSSSKSVSAGGLPTTSIPSASPTSSNTGASPTSNNAGAATVLVASTKLGTVLTDANGLTLYTFDKDAAGAGTSACTGGCATAWPPLTTTGTPTPGPGVTGTLGKISGGQVTWNGHPLYRWMGDHAQGDVTGDGINGFHVALAGSAASSPPTSSGGGGGY